MTAALDTLPAAAHWPDVSAAVSGSLDVVRYCLVYLLQTTVS